MRVFIIILFLFFLATAKDWKFSYTKNPWIDEQMENFELTN
jgi:hypothetical protein